ncbi:MAG TPA: winged helix-turn-helix transcriptional regulator [Candidatus Polarisedimenticolia bacterium]|nr:winged helix-turn-helix transcriptional regulator [Candidatus Polarisedimenticolia bacterium]
MGIAFSDRPAADRWFPSGYKGPRGALLVTLKRSGGLAARDLAVELGLSANAVRHHLKELEADGVIAYRREQRGVGAPTYVWHLSAAGEALFPERSKEVVTDLLDRVAEQTGRQPIVAALETRFAELTRRLQADLADAPPARRMEVVMRALVEGGYMAEWEAGENGARLTEHHCAIKALAERFPEVCEAEAKFLAAVLAAPVEREAHMLAGCPACEYRVRFPEDGPAPLIELNWDRGVREERA